MLLCYLQALQSIAEFRGLRQLVLADCSAVTTGGLEQLSGLQGLHSLALLRCPRVGDKGMTVLHSLTCLTYLALTGCTKVMLSPCLRNLPSAPASTLHTACLPACLLDHSTHCLPACLPVCLLQNAALATINCQRIRASLMVSSALHITCCQEAVRQCHEWQDLCQAMRLLIGFIVRRPESTAKHIVTLQACMMQHLAATQTHTCSVYQLFLNGSA